MKNRFFGIFTLWPKTDRIRFNCLPQAERVRIKSILDEAQNLNIDSPPESLRSMMGELGRLEMQYPFEKAPEIWEAADMRAQHIFYYLTQRSHKLIP